MLPPDLAVDVQQLALDERFRRLMKHFIHQQKRMEVTILEPSTPADEREILVRVRQHLDFFVTNIVNEAHEILENQKKKIEAGQTRRLLDAVPD